MTRTAITPKLVVHDAAGAIAYYERGCEAELVSRFDHDGVVVFAELLILGGSVTLKDADAHDRCSEPGPIIDVVHPDPDALSARMVGAGAQALIAMSDRPWGGRWGRVQDPYGVQWLLQSPETSDAAEIQAMLDQMG